VPAGFFVSDLHGSIERYEKLFRAITDEAPEIVFLGGDLLPSGFLALEESVSFENGFLKGYLARRLLEIRRVLGDSYPRIYAILGNDDIRVEEETIIELAGEDLLEYVHGTHTPYLRWTVYGYSCVPPTPFHLKDWERYDVSRYVDPGSVSPEEGGRTVPVPERVTKYSTIKDDLEKLTGQADLQDAVFLFHSPPYNTALDRAALDGKTVEGVPLDTHVGSIAIRRFIEDRQPLVTLHGHIHESTHITRRWKDKIGRTILFSAAHDGPELALVRFDLESLDRASRVLV
jgi:Icc-related predicted phosphoesterase